MKIKYAQLSISIFAIIGFLSLGVFAQNGALRGDLDGTRWVLTEINNRRVGSTKAFLEISRAENRFSGNAGCNRMFGEASVSGGRRISFSGIGTTKMFCTGGGVMKLERDFTEALARATRYERNGDRLRLFARNRLILQFRATKDDSNDDRAVKLEDKKWMLEAIKGASLPKIPSAPFLVFDPAKQSAGGDTGCNAFGGSYTATGADRLRIFDVISTMRACIEDERMNVERDFKDGLDRANRYEIVKGRLHLYQNRTLLLTFRGENK